MSESPSTLGANGGGSSDNESSSEVDLECSICLSTAVHPVQLPCTHIFCFLCVKGSANRSKRCALCRQVIPPHYLFKPTLLKQEDLSRDTSFDDGHQWYYEGNRGWWQYDERTSSELEAQFKMKCEKVEVLIAGFLYVVDFENMIQYRRNDPSRRRRIKRDVSNIPIKGVAGLKITVPDPMAENRREGDGGFEVDTNQNRSGGIQSSRSLPPNPHQSGGQSDNVDTVGGHSPQGSSDRVPVSQSDRQNTEDGNTLNRSASTTLNAVTGNIDEVRADVNRNRSGAVRLGAVGEVAADNDGPVQNVTSDALSSEGPGSNARKNTADRDTGTCDLQESQSAVRTVRTDPNHTETSELEGDNSAVNVTNGQLTRQSGDSSPRETTQQHGMQLRMRNGRSVKRP